MTRKSWALFLLVVFAAAVLLSCGGGTSGGSFTPRSVTPGNVYVTSSDAPLPSVLSFQITFNALTVSDGSSSVPLLAAPANVEFSRLLGMRTLLALNEVPPGTYTSTTVTLASPVISYLDISQNPATVGTINGTLTQTQLTIPLNPPLVVTSSGLGGLHLHFNLRDSVELDAGGQITGNITPHLGLRVLSISDEDAQIDELLGSFVSSNPAANTFVLQRPNGRQLTIRVDNNTRWEGTDNINTLTVPAILEVSGRVQADGSILADNVEVATRDAALLGGLVLGTTPAAGPADAVTLLVREQIPVTPGIQVGLPATVNVTAQTAFAIHNINLPIANLLFNRSSMVVGQRVHIGGTPSNNTLDARRIVLHRQGMDGTGGSVQVVNGNQGSFLLQNNGFFGYLFGGPIKVVSSDMTIYVNLLGLADISNFPAATLRVGGLILRDPNTGDPVFVARRVERLLPH